MRRKFFIDKQEFIYNYFKKTENRNIVLNYFYGLIGAAYRTYLEIDVS